MGWALALALAAAPEPATPAAKTAAPKAAPAARAAPAPAAPREDAPAPQPFHWEVPGLLDWVDSAGTQMSDGVPVTLQLARSSLELEALLQHFATSFEKAGLFIPPGGLQPELSREPMLTALDPVRRVSYTVIFQPNPDKTVTLLLGTANFSRSRLQTQVKWAPLFPGAQQVTSMDMEGAASAAFRVRSTPEQVLAFYREQLGKAGFVEKAEEPGSFQRGDERLRVSVRKEQEEVLVDLQRRLGAEP